MQKPLKSVILEKCEITKHVEYKTAHTPNSCSKELQQIIDRQPSKSKKSEELENHKPIKQTTNIFFCSNLFASTKTFVCLFLFPFSFQFITVIFFWCFFFFFLVCVSVCSQSRRLAIHTQRLFDLKRSKSERENLEVNNSTIINSIDQSEQKMLSSVRDCTSEREKDRNNE